MAYNGGRRSSSAQGNSNNSSLILGILIGMVIGLAVAGGVAWHLSKRPSPFTNKEQHEVPSSAAEAPAQKTVAVPPAAHGPSAASGVAGGKQDYTFYKILTEPDNSSGKNPGRAAAKHPAAPRDGAKPAAATAYFLQAGSFSTADDADKLKAKLALLGMEANVQTADVPGKGTRYRVRLGPYHSADELDKANSTLKQNGITGAATMRAQ